MSTIWKNRPFLIHYFFGFGKTMYISSDSDLGRKIIQHLDGIMKTRFQEGIAHSCESYYNITTDAVDFTNNPYLFSLGNSTLKTRTICGNGNCLITYTITDAFEHALDINDNHKEYYKYWGFDIAIPYKIKFRYDIFFIGNKNK